MHSFFWKVFLIFWGGALLLLIFAVLLSRPGENRMGVPGSVEELADRAIELYEKSDYESLREYTLSLVSQRQIDLWLLDETGKPTQRKVPYYIQDAISTFPQLIKPQDNPSGPFYIETLNRTSNSGQLYRLVLVYNEKNKPGHATPALIKQYLLILLAISIASLLIAWKLTRPIRILQSVTHQFAEGEMQSRAPDMITNRRDSIGDLGREYNYMADRVESLLESQTRLLRDVSHELRTPLARIQVALALAEQRSTGGENELKRIDSELERLDKLIGQILKLSRLEAGVNEFNITTFSFTKLLKTIKSDIEFEFSRQHKKLNLLFHTEYIITADQTALASVFENVIRNAMNYTPENGHVEVELVVEDDQFKITVRDHGSGVEENELERLFTPFYRASNTQQEKKEGYGVGLAISRYIIELHQGKIIAENHPEGGLIVSIFLPKSLHLNKV